MYPYKNRPFPTFRPEFRPFPTFCLGPTYQECNFVSCFTFKFLTNKIKRMVKINQHCVLVYFVWNKWVQNRTPKKHCSKKSYQISQSLLPRLLKAVRFIFCSALHCYVFSYLSNATRIKVLCLIVSNGTFTCSASSSVHVCYGLGVCLS